MEDIKVRYKIESVVQLDFEINKKKIEKKLTSGDLLFNITVNLLWRLQESRVENHVIIRYLLKSSQEQVLSLTTLNTFEYQTQGPAITVNNGMVIAPDKFLADIFSVSVNTARGLLIARTERTDLDGVILGTFDAQKMVDKIKESFDSPKAV
jgi:hypothetical protein